MPRIRAFDVLTLTLCVGVSYYSANKFFGPIIIDQLKKDGNLRTDIPVPEFDEEGNRVDFKEQILEAERQRRDLAGSLAAVDATVSSSTNISKE